jgi:hypothetical protein
MQQTIHGGRALRWLTATSVAVVFSTSGTNALAQEAADGPGGGRRPLVIQKQGSFMVGGTVIDSPGTFDPLHPTPEGQTFHGDHAYVQYQIPPDARRLNLVLWHGAGQFSKTWETTPDGRDGYQNIFLRRGWPVYIIDQPRRGRAGRSTDSITIIPTPNEQDIFGNFRLGVWPNFFPGVQFPRDSGALDQYYRQQTPNTGAFDLEVLSDAVTALLDSIGPSILITHSQGGGPGWQTGMKSSKVRAIVSYEPGSNFPFPAGEVPPPIPSAFNGQSLSALEVPLDEFLKLTKFPIQIVYGDNIPGTPTNTPGDIWRIRIEMARLWREAVNRHGGDVEVLHLPEVGVFGNTHFPFSDLNNREVANLLSRYLHRKGLDHRRSDNAVASAVAEERE